MTAPKLAQGGTVITPFRRLRPKARSSPKSTEKNNSETIPRQMTTTKYHEAPLRHSRPSQTPAHANTSYDSVTPKPLTCHNTRPSQRHKVADRLNDHCQACNETVLFVNKCVLVSRISCWRCVAVRENGTVAVAVAARHGMCLCKQDARLPYPYYYY